MNSLRLLLTSLLILLNVAPAYAIKAPAIGQVANTTRIAAQLGWLDTPLIHALCTGYYQEPLLDFKSNGLAHTQDTDISADTGSFYKWGRSKLQGNVVIRQPYKESRAHVAYIYRQQETGDITQIDLYGNVQIREPGRLLIADKAHLKPTEHTGQLQHVLYRIALSDESSPYNGIRTLYGMNAWGQAETVEQENQHRYIFKNVSYTTCPPGQNHWQLRSHRLIVDRKKQVAYAYGSTLRVNDVPIFYLPYVSYPITDKRESGFLLPLLSHSQDRGYDITLPYYLNLAPNVDATLFVRDMDKRGTMGGGELRYLTPRSHGSVHLHYLPDDKAFKAFRRQNPTINSWGNQRGFVDINHDTLFSPHWSTHIMFQHVSDDFYFQDLSSDLMDTTRYQLPQLWTIMYQGNHWDFSLRTEKYRTLHPFNNLIVGDLYAKLPELTLHADYPDSLGGGDWQWTLEASNFDWPGSALITKPNGTRLHFSPQASFPWENTWAFVTPTIALDATTYTLDNVMPGIIHSMDRILPILSVHAGLHFERNLTLWGNHFHQTLEPQFFYLFVPYTNQNNIPLFDTNLHQFTFAQLWRNNLYNGIDRISDANQLTLALTSRFLETESGIEKLQVSLGGIIYFHDRRVGWCTNQEKNCALPANVIFFTSPTASTSPLIGLIDYHLNPFWSLNANAAWEPQTKNMNNASLRFHYEKTNKKQATVSYTYARSELTTNLASQSVTNALHTVNVSGVWQTNNHWSLLGGWSYNIAFKHPQTYFAGAQYESCCFALRLLAGRTLTSVSQIRNTTFNNAIYLQIALRGFTTVSSHDPRQILQTNIPGFTDDLF